jgi:hypothetical protein
MDFDVEEGPKHKPFTALLYGPPGARKTWLASHAPNPLFADIEGGTEYFKTIKRVPKDKFPTYDSVRQFFAWAAKTDFETIVFDSATAVEQIVAADLLRKNPGWGGSLANADYGKGFAALTADMVRFAQNLSWLNRRGKNVILIAHARVVEFKDPMGQPYDRYEPKLHEKVWADLVSMMDTVLFLRPRVSAVDDKTGRAIGDGSELHTVEIPGAIAKNRFDLPRMLTIPYVNPGQSFDDPIWRLLNVHN